MRLLIYIILILLNVVAIINYSYSKTDSYKNVSVNTKSILITYHEAPNCCAPQFMILMFFILILFALCDNYLRLK
jgi:hypothetical protein